MVKTDENRFQLAVEQMKDCLAHVADEGLSEDEAKAREEFLSLCEEITCEFVDTDVMEDSCCDH